MGNHRSKTAKMRRFHLARNTLLGLNELTYSLSITYRYSTVAYSLAYVKRRKSIELVAIKGMNAYRKSARTRLVRRANT